MTTLTLLPKNNCIVFLIRILLGKFLELLLSQQKLQITTENKIWNWLFTNTNTNTNTTFNTTNHYNYNHSAATNNDVITKSNSSLNININHNKNKNNTLSSAKHRHQKQNIQEHGDGDGYDNSNISSIEQIIIDFGFYPIPYDFLHGYTLSHVDTLNKFAK